MGTILADNLFSADGITEFHSWILPHVSPQQIFQAWMFLDCNVKIPGGLFGS
jgi:hypothetical protein